MNIRNTKLLRALNQELQKFEQRCKQIIGERIHFWALGDVPEVFEIGKGIRPALHFFFCKALNSISEINFTYAMLSEMLHFATLVHDDVLDEALLRRLDGTLKATYGNLKAILIGDLILATCYKIASSLKNTRFLQLLSDTSYKLCKGEILQHNEKYNFNITTQKYLEIIYNKTAVLFGFSCSLADFEGKYYKLLYDIGTKIGIMYQIIDDFLDIVANEKIIGKSIGRDISKGSITLPLILLFQIANEREKNIIKEKLLNKNNNIMDYLRNVINKYQIKHRIYYYVEHIYENIEELARHILAKKSFDDFKDFLNYLLNYIKSTG
ncbi:MAG: polyprenyl synthetase family protein [Planctomycetota bacterium]